MCKIDVWLELEEPDIVSVLPQLAQLESRMMSIPFPAGGSIYYTNDLEKGVGRTGIPLNDGRFWVGVNVRLHMQRLRDGSPHPVPRHGPKILRYR